MNIESIQAELQRLLKITQGWQSNIEVSPIERDIALDSVKRLYEQIAFDTPAIEPAPIVEEQEEETQELEVEVELTYYEGEDMDLSEEEEEIESEPVVEEPEAAEEETKEVESKAEEVEPSFELEDISIISDGTQSDTDDTIARQKSRRNAILSLYNDAPETIAQKLASEIQSQTISDNSSTGASINDRYIIAQELFAGDMSAYEALQERLNQMSNFDDCMLHIVENYDWNAESEATRLFISALEQRFSK